MTIEAIKNITTPILKRNKVKKAALFGSMANRHYSSESDVDILVELDDSHSLLDFVGIKIELEEALDKKVDLVEFDAVKPALRKYILKEPISIYE